MCTHNMTSMCTHTCASVCRRCIVWIRPSASVLELCVRESVCVRARVRACVRACARVYVSVCLCVFVCVCVWSQEVP